MVLIIQVALFTLAFRMLPRSLDAVLAEAFVDALKFPGVPALIGLPLADYAGRRPGSGWIRVRRDPRSPPPARGGA